jgi:alcohol dehydrogenase class IV
MSQLIEFGNDSLNKLHNFLKKESPKHILIVSGKQSYNSCGASNLLDEILSNYIYTRFYDFKENPKIEDVVVGVNVFNNNKCDLIIAVGGGSVIDMAKLIIFFKNKKYPYTDYFTSNLKSNELIPFIAIPTTSGTGSEVTHFAVVYSDNKKFSIADRGLMANFVFIVPKFTYGINNYLTAVTGLDAFSQAIESFWNINSNKESLSYAQEAIELIWENLPKVLKNNNNFKSRDLISKASMLAGKSINITKTTAPHAFSYFLTSKFDIPHGHAVALTLPFFCKYNCEINSLSNNDLRGVEYVKSRIEIIAKIINTKPEYLDIIISKFIKDLNLINNYGQIFKNKNTFIEWKDNVNMQRLKNNPRIVDSKTWNGLEKYLLNTNNLTNI